ncbi:hypothetical protein ACFW04_004328 [Cataglyphis niger]
MLQVNFKSLKKRKKHKFNKKINNRNILFIY